MPCSAERLAYCRRRYEERIADPAFREKLRKQALDRYYARKEKLRAAGHVPRPVGRPRTYHAEEDM